MAERAVATAKTSEAKQKCSNFCNQNTSYSSSGSPADRILQLQRTAGNQAVQRLIKSRTLQAKLRIGQPNNIYEQEADRVAEQVMRMTDPASVPQSPVNSRPEGLSIQSATRYPEKDIQRKEDDDEEEGIVQMKQSSPSYVAGSQPGVPPSVHEVLSSPGLPLDPATRAHMEPRFGHDFSRVRVHTGAAAEQSAREVNALAYTMGHNIVFGAGRFAPGTHQGRRLLAHELTHAVQQSGANEIRVGQSNEKHVLSPIPFGFPTISRTGAEPAIQRGFGELRVAEGKVELEQKERELRLEKKVGNFTVELDHGRAGMYLIHFLKLLTWEEVLGILFKDGTLPQGFQLEYKGPDLFGFTWRLTLSSRVIEPSSYNELSPVFKKHFKPKILKGNLLTPEEIAEKHAAWEAFLDSRPVYLGGQSVREAFEKCLDHEVGTGCWGRRAGFFYYTRGQVLELREVSGYERVNRDLEWWLDQGYSLHEAYKAEVEHLDWILRQQIFAFATALSSYSGVAPRNLKQLTVPPPSKVGQGGQIIAKAVQIYTALKQASGEDITESDIWITALAGILAGGTGYLNASKRPGGPEATKLPPTTSKPGQKPPITSKVKPQPPAAAPKQPVKPPITAKVEPPPPATAPKQPVKPTKPAKPKAKELGRVAGKKVLAETPTLDGKHKIKVTRDGIQSCSPSCPHIIKEIDEAMQNNPRLKEELMPLRKKLESAQGKVEDALIRQDRLKDPKEALKAEADVVEASKAAAEEAARIKPQVDKIIYETRLPSELSFNEYNTPEAAFGLHHGKLKLVKEKIIHEEELIKLGYTKRYYYRDENGVKWSFDVRKVKGSEVYRLKGKSSGQEFD